MYIMVNKRNMDFWEEAMKKSPKSYRELFAAEKGYLKEHISSASKVLEVGCGKGRSMEDIANSTPYIYGIDNDVVAVSGARELFGNCSSVSVLLADGKDIPFKDSFFDYVVSMTTPANFGDDKYEVYGEMRRVLKDDGEMIMSVFNEDAFSDRIKTYMALNVDIKEIRDNTTVVFNEELGSNVSEQFSRSELEDIFDKSGFKSEEIVKAGVGYICRARKA